MEAKRVLCVVGPTASGKTKLSILLAERYNGEVVSIDSMQIYRGMSIGTAAPTAAEMGRVPHHMVAVAEPGDNWSAARFTAAADDCIQDILERNKLPVLAGGTGLYLEAVVSGRTFAPGASGGAVRRELELELEAGGIEPLLAQLRAVDPAAAGRLHPADTKRILRALEVYRETGETISRHNEESCRMPDKYDALYIGLAFRDREDMRKLIDRRVDEMLAGGPGPPGWGDAQKRHRPPGHRVQGAPPRAGRRADPGAGGGGNQAALPAVRQEAADMAEAKPTHPLGVLGKREEFCRRSPNCDRNYHRSGSTIGTGRTSRPSQ